VPQFDLPLDELREVAHTYDHRRLYVDAVPAVETAAADPRVDLS